MFRSLFRATTVIVLGCGAATVAAQSPLLYSVDPYDVRPMPGMQPQVSTPMLWQMDPFGVGYNLLSGYRPIYGGARQPIGHEIIATHPNGNGYVYRPVYAPSPGYHYSLGGTLIIEHRGRYPETNSAGEYVVPPPMPASRSGPREF